LQVAGGKKVTEWQMVGLVRQSHAGGEEDGAGRRGGSGDTFGNHVRAAARWPIPS